MRAALPTPVLTWARRRRALMRSRRPRTFDEKVVYKIHRDRRPLLVTFADKVAAREYVVRVAPECGLVPVYATTCDLRAVDRSSLPREFVVKASHASGGVLLVADWAPRTNTTPTPADGLCRTTVHPDRLDWDQLCATTDAWLRTPYVGPLGEWAYSQIEPTLIVEALLVGTDGRTPTDYKLLVFDGRCRVLEVAAGRFGDYRELMFTPDWELIDDVADDRAFARGVAPPATLATMIDIAERLGGQTDFVRVDLYEVDGRVVFGELTNYPGGGHSMDTRRADELLGSYWTVPRRYR